jgi:hypothetical protein
MDWRAPCASRRKREEEFQMKHAFALLAVVFASGLAINAQQVVTLSTPGGAITSGYITLESKTLKGAPYSAETVNDSTQVLADGNRIVRHTTGRVYRDSEGRIRREEDAPAPGSVGPDRPIVLAGPSISIVDPVAGASYTLDPQSHVAWKTASRVGPVLMESAVRRRTEELSAQLQFKVEGGAVAIAEQRGGGRGGEANRRNVEEQLAPRQIEGVLAEGHRNTTTIPAGAIGNEQPITIVSEEWTSPDLGVLVMTDHKDPRMGESSYRLLNIVRGEPDGSLFQVPADYTIKETGIRRLEPAR